MKYVTVLFLISGIVAFEIPFFVPKFLKHKASASTVERTEVADVPITPRIAIVGAGAGGSSAAFWISKAKSRFGLGVDIDVYDRNDYIGGRKSPCQSAQGAR